MILINSIISFISREDGISGCAVFMLIVVIGIAVLGGFLYIQFSDVFQLANSETIGQILTIIEEIDDKEILNEIEQLEDLEEIEALSDLEIEDLEQIKNIIPVVKNIYEYLPQGIINMFQERKVEEDLKAPIEKELTKSEEELLPESIETHPDMNLVGYRGYEDIPEMIWEKVEEKYINEDTKVLTYEANFPEREIAELIELKEVTEDITDEMIEEKREQLTELYNIYEITNWHKEKLLAKGWTMRGEEIGLEDKLFYQHEKDGYFIIGSPEKFIYTPKK